MTSHLPAEAATETHVSVRFSLDAFLVQLVLRLPRAEAGRARIMLPKRRRWPVCSYRVTCRSVTGVHAPCLVLGSSGSKRICVLLARRRAVRALQGVWVSRGSSSLATCRAALSSANCHAGFEGGGREWRDVNQGQRATLILPYLCATPTCLCAKSPRRLVVVLERAKCQSLNSRSRSRGGALIHLQALISLAPFSPRCSDRQCERLVRHTMHSYCVYSHFTSYAA